MLKMEIPQLLFPSMSGSILLDLSKMINTDQDIPAKMKRLGLMVLVLSSRTSGQLAMDSSNRENSKAWEESTKPK